MGAGVRLICGLLGAGLLLVLLPDPAWAWGPGTHVRLGLGVLDSLHILPEAVRALIAAHPRDFLYGSVAADISLAKKYVPEGRHCHHWHVGEEIYGQADTERLRAVGLGYLSHLAADTVAHNVFVPRKLLLTSSTQALGHSYWEHRMDVEIGEGYMRTAREVVMGHDHSDADDLFDRVLSATLFSFRTNRRLFRGMIRFQDNDRWQAVFSRVLASSRWTLGPAQVEGYLERSFEHVVDYLCNRGESFVAGLDPIGEENLRVAKKLRRAALRTAPGPDPERLHEAADRHFPLPDLPHGHWRAHEVERKEGSGADGPGGEGGSAPR